MRKGGFIPRVINVAVFVLLEMAALHFVKDNGELQRIAVARASHGFMGTVWGSTQRIRSYFSLSRTNRELAEENFRLFEELSLAREALHRAGMDTVGTSIARSSGFSYIPAEVEKVSRNKQHNYLILNRGFEDGIAEKSGIITPSGIIGIVDAVSAHHCYAISFQNSDISISARIGTEGGTGLLVWDGHSRTGAELKELPLQYKYNPGDTVFTSGHSLMFPPDIPLGISGESRIINGATRSIRVELFQDAGAARYVTVVHNTAFDEIEEFMQ